LVPTGTMNIYDFRYNFYYSFFVIVIHCRTEPIEQMKVFITFILPVYLIMVLSSCTKIVYIGKRIDPEIILEKEHHNIVFVNLFNYTIPANVNRKDRISYHSGVMNLLDGLSSFSSDSSFSFVVGDTLKKSVRPGDLTTLLPQDTITNICNRFNSNLLLTLDSASIFFERDTIVNSYYGVRYRTIDFKLNTRFYLSLYSDEGDLIDRSEVEQASIFVPRSSNSGYILVPSISRASEEIGYLAFQAGQDYTVKFFPQIIHETKQLYTGTVFKESNNYIFARNWNKATELLEQLLKNNDPLVADKARHNLEVVKEASQAGER
jgi:Family of unknown function (DUF6340)